MHQNNSSHKLVKLAIASAVAAALPALAVAAGPISGVTLPEGMTSADIVFTGPGYDKDQWTATLNGSAVDSGFKFNVGYGTITPASLSDLSVTLTNFTQSLPGNVLYLTSVANPLSINVKVDHSLRAGDFYGYYFAGNSAKAVAINSVFSNISASSTGTKAGDVIGASDWGASADSSSTYGSLTHVFDHVSSENGSLIGTLFSGNGKASANSVQVTIKNSSAKSAKASQVYLSNAKFGAFNVQLENSQFTDNVFGIFAQSSSSTQMLPTVSLTDDFVMNVVDSSASSIYGLRLETTSAKLDGVQLNVEHSNASPTGKTTALYFAPPTFRRDEAALVNGDVIANITGGSSAFEYTAVTYATLGDAPVSYSTVFNDSRIALIFDDATAPRARTVAVYKSLVSGDEPHMTVNNGSIELFMNGYSSGTGDRSEDNPTAMCLGDNADIALNNSNVYVTLRANEKNALSNQSLYGIAMHGANAKVNMTGDIVVTLEGDAGELGFGRKSANGTTTDIGGIYAVAKKETSVFNQTGERILQIGSAEHPFISSEENGLTSPFANFTQVAVAEGSSLFMTEKQSDNFIHDDAYGSQGAVLNAVGVSAKGGTLSVAGSADAAHASDTGLRLANSSTIHAKTVSFTGQSTVASKGSATLSGDTVKTAQDAVVNFKTENATMDYAVNLRGAIENEGLFSLEGSAIAVDSGADATTALGRIRTVGENESAVYLGAGEYTVDEFKGEAKSVVVTDLQNNQGVGITKNEGSLNIVASSKANDQYANAEDAAAALAEKVDVTQTDQDAHSLIVVEGTINDGLTATLDKDGSVENVIITKNSTLEAYGTVAALSAFQWRHDMNDLTKRMGELRTSPEGVGAWARVYGSEQNYGAQNIQARNHSVQVGVDTTAGRGWTVGAAFTYTDGSLTYDRGEGDNKAYGVAAYGSWFADNGQFVDLIAKYSRLDNDFDVNGMSGRFDNNAWSVSAEYGWHWNLTDVAFVEPQVEVTYGQVIGDDFTAQNGVRVGQDDFESLIGRVGVRSGFYFPNNKGVIYARASVLHDFQGEMESTARLDNSVNSVRHDIGGTWYEWGIGANFNVMPNACFYVDLERTNGGEVVEDWRYNIGARYVF